MSPHFKRNCSLYLSTKNYIFLIYKYLKHRHTSPLCYKLFPRFNVVNIFIFKSRTQQLGFSMVLKTTPHYPWSLLLTNGSLLVLEWILRFWWSLLKHVSVWPQATSQMCWPLPACSLRSSGIADCCSKVEDENKRWPWFSFQAPRLWNGLSEEVMLAESVTSFNHFLKKHFYRLAFLW